MLKEHPVERADEGAAAADVGQAEETLKLDLQIGSTHFSAVAGRGFGRASTGSDLMKLVRFVALGGVLALTFAATSMVGRMQTPASDAGAAPFDGLHFRSIGPAIMSGPDRRHRRVRAEHRDLLRRHRTRRRVEDDEQRHDVRRRSSRSRA